MNPAAMECWWGRTPLLPSGKSLRDGCRRIPATTLRSQRWLFRESPDLGEHFDRLPRLKSQALDREQRIIGESLNRIRQSDIYALCRASADHFRPQLAELLGAVATLLPSVSNAITHDYFSLAQTSQQLA